MWMTTAGILSRGRDVARAGGVDGVGRGRIFLAAVEVVERGGVDDQIGHGIPWRESFMELVFAYIDPGLGSLVIQALIAGLVAAPIIFRRQLMRFTHRLLGQDDPPELPSSPADTPQGWLRPALRPAIQRRPASSAIQAHTAIPPASSIRRDGVIYRQIDPSFADDSQGYPDSGLYDRLRDEGVVIAHTEVDPELAAEPPAHRRHPAGAARAHLLFPTSGPSASCRTRRC